MEKEHMYHIEYVFRLDLVLRKTKEICDTLRMPYPILKGAVTETVSLDMDTLFTKEQEKEFVEETKKFFEENFVTESLCCVKAEYVGKKNFRKNF